MNDTIKPRHLAVKMVKLRKDIDDIYNLLTLLENYEHDIEQRGVGDEDQQRAIKKNGRAGKKIRR